MAQQKAIQFYRNNTVITPSNEKNAITLAKETIESTGSTNDGEITLARYQESNNDPVKTLIGVYHKNGNSSTWDFVSDEINKIHFGTCSTGGSTATKVCTVEPFIVTTETVNSATVTHAMQHTIIAVLFTNKDTNTDSAPKLNVNRIGAKAIYYNNAEVTSISANPTVGGSANCTHYYYYDATLKSGNGAWYYMGKSVDSNTTYTNVALGQGYAVQNNASASASITATLSSYTATVNGIVSVKFNYDVPANATLNINGKGAKAIYNKDAAITDGVIKAGDTATFIYNSYYRLISIDTWQDKAEPVNADWNASSGLAQILNKPTIPSASSTAPTQTRGNTGTVGTSTNYARADHTHPICSIYTTYSDLINGTSPVAGEIRYESTNRQFYIFSLTGNKWINFSSSTYIVDITTVQNNTYTCNRTNAEIYSAWNDGKCVYAVIDDEYALSIAAIPGSTYAYFNGNTYDDPTEVKTITVQTANDTQTVTVSDTTMQTALVSGTNIKTINNTSILGSGNINTIEIHYGKLVTEHHEYVFYPVESYNLSPTITPTFSQTALTPVAGDLYVDVLNFKMYVYGVESNFGLAPFSIVGERNATVDSTLTDNGTNAVQGGVIKAYVDTAATITLVDVTGGSSSLTQNLQPNKFYRISGSPTSITFTLTSGTGLCIYAGKFTAGVDDMAITLPSGVTLTDDTISIEQGKTYEFSIADGVCLIKNVTAAS